MKNEQMKFHQNFEGIFTNEELEDIVENATVVTENSIVLSTEDNFFELSLGIGDSVDIYCDSNNDDTNKQLTKDEFMKLYKNSPSMQMKHIIIDE